MIEYNWIRNLHLYGSKSYKLNIWTRDDTDFEIDINISQNSYTNEIQNMNPTLAYDSQNKKIVGWNFEIYKMIVC